MINSVIGNVVVHGDNKLGGSSDCSRYRCQAAEKYGACDAIKMLVSEAVMDDFVQSMGQPD